MVKARKAAAKAARRVQEAMYDGLCTITEYRGVRDEKTKLTSHREVPVAEGVPCRLSFETVTAASQTEAGAAVSQTVKLFLAPEIAVKNGSKLTVIQNGVTEVYSASGPPAVYDTHQEVMLVLFRGWA